MTFVASKTIVVPVAILERDVLCSADTCDGLMAGKALLGEELAEAF